LISWLAVKLKLADLPAGVTWLQLYGAACVAAIGFTMALFVTNLAYAKFPEFLLEAKLGVLVGSLLAAVWGYCILMLASTRSPHTEADQH
ncbi:MAG: Na+/H+ antiporter NhaA, partial [Vampirovibrionales bacterium]|nr:Na+/H+ antiporter NhaA [Vampirovibrionales bacterium]